MDAMALLLDRQSHGGLEAPAPTAEQMELIYRAALRAPDHGELRPWRFIEYSGAGRETLGSMFARAEQEDNPEVSDRTLEKARAKPLRAPVVIAVVASVTPNHKVPRIEQIISAGCAAHAMLYAAHAQGLGAMWRTGGFAHHQGVRRAMGLEPHDELVGFLYLGHCAQGDRTPKPLDPRDFVERIDG
ncbi:NAD(P)H nitroreductase [Kushneria marisflavi]|uniref:Putative NAD(P)H nitroreductase n=1 Tax=Kushneria marisflavi TaxID=157779 RepID=A0A240USJ9_9GAMM|nr:NAD(P)H nitroreductase [Kushneria marisflavi]ART64116.1 NAD(P)H nitroreductase [Kushneria marisflavi]RKD85862.1 nitroreductase [Kushneria marisflavi]